MKKENLIRRDTKVRERRRKEKEKDLNDNNKKIKKRYQKKARKRDGK